MCRSELNQKHNPQVLISWTTLAR